MQHFQSDKACLMDVVNKEDDIEVFDLTLNLDCPFNSLDRLYQKQVICSCLAHNSRS